MVPTGLVCLCGHKQMACLKCRRIWAYNHKTPGAWERDWNGEESIKRLVKVDSDKLGVTSYEAYFDKMVPEWKKNLQSTL